MSARKGERSDPVPVPDETSAPEVVEVDVYHQTARQPGLRNKEVEKAVSAFRDIDTESCLREIRSRAVVVVVVLDGIDPVGFAVLVSAKDGYDVDEVLHLSLIKARGVARPLFRELATWCREHGFSAVTVDARWNEIKAYRRVGFREDKNRHEQSGDTVAMIRRFYPLAPVPDDRQMSDLSSRRGR